MTAWNFLVDLGKELGKEFEMSQFVTILEDNWIDPQSFCKISDEQLVRLGIPLGLIIKIRDRIRNQETTDRASATKDDKTDKPEYQNNTSELPLRKKSNSESLETCSRLEKFAASDSIDFLTRQKSIKYLHSIFSNIYANPSWKHRNLRIENPAIHDFIYSFQPTFDFLLCVGFVESEDKSNLILKELFVSRLTDSLHFLAELQNSCFGLPVQPLPKTSMFNPYTVGVLSAASDGSMAAFEKVTKQNQAELLTEKQMLEAKKNALEKGPIVSVPRLPLDLVFTKNSPAEPIAAPTEASTDTVEDNDSMTREELAHLKFVLDRSQTFQSKQKQEINVMKKITKNNTTRVRIVFPNKDRVEFTVYSWEPLREVKRIIEDKILSLEAAMEKWTLEDRIPGSKLQDEKSLFSQGLTPSCSLTIKFPSSTRSDGFVRSF
eukprot:GHVP01053319.1.p1 GENE.GHVP01053319.1~~GHVP01053319.1.p1  ORF type:complete len:441 (+),score=75.79 GHVP01053319.1:24-1325(+)